MGDHFNCMAEVDRTVPAQTQQRYVRTETTCKQNWPFNELICNAVPIYDTVVTNQPQRDVAMAECRGRLNNQRVLENSYSSQQTSTSNTATKRPNIYNIKEAESACASAHKRNSPYFSMCVDGLVNASKSQPPSNSAAQSSKMGGKSVYNQKDAEIACTSATVKGSDAFNKCVEELVKTSR